jgi:outer membrane protein OmpA-like peptidoglycan-associated protein
MEKETSMHTPGFPGRRTLAAIAVFGVFALSGAAFAQEVGSLRGKPSKEQILQALSPAAAQPAFRTRGLSIGGADANKPATPDAPAASGGGAPQPQAKAGPRALDLEIPFEFNSDRLTNDGKEVLDQLGEALKSDELASARAIVLEGHTDAKGSAAYNKLLSTRRAQSVKNFLATKHSIPSTKLRAVGKGSTELADPKNPEDGVNRRVRIIVEG